MKYIMREKIIGGIPIFVPPVKAFDKYHYPALNMTGPASRIFAFIS
jgi:hypothetical protein